MTYAYRCPGCEHDFDVMKRVAERDRVEMCPKCETLSARQFAPSRVYFSGAKVTHAEFNPAFGCVVKNKQHKDRLCKERGMVEIGNDFKSSENLQKHYDSERASRHKKSWDEA